MASIIKRKVRNKTYYYLEESIKRGKKWVKQSTYLGDSILDNRSLEKAFLVFSKKLKKKGVVGVTPPLTEFITRAAAAKLEKAVLEKKEFIQSLSAQQKADFTKREKTTFITDSNAIEGSTLDYYLTNRVVSDRKRIERLLKKGFVVTGINREEQEALNLSKCLELYEKFLEKKADLSDEMILRLHLILLSKISGYEEYTGIYRPVNVMIRGSSHEFPHHTQVLFLMRELLAWYIENKRLIHPVELAAKLHTKFTSIHPFADGNGRMARLLMNYVLQLNGFPFTNIPLKRRSAYMKTQEAGNHEDCKPFTEFLTQEIIKQNKKLKK